MSGKTASGPHAGRRVTRIGDPIDPESVDWTLVPRCATLDGFSLHANVAVHADDRPRLQRLLSYYARPPIAMERLERLAEGCLLYRFKRPWRDGSEATLRDLIFDRVSGE
ncbi:MAG: transposase [Acidobacteria bacterium]|nr:transposase [Acidobacteriota bacterium]